MIPPIPVQTYVTVAAATELTNRRAKNLDGDSSSDTLAETFNAVTPSTSSQAENGARQVANRFKPLDNRKSAEEIEDEEEKLLYLLSEKFGLEKPHGLPIQEAAAYLKEILYSPRNTYDLRAVEKDLGFDLIGISLKDFLDAMIDSNSEAATRVSIALKNFLDDQELQFRQTALDEDITTNPEDDQDPGIYSPYEK
ncbi:MULTISPECIES: hypothetical protein [Bartonella]|uniref:hypothetical protein n=1 Tax=Bartonella TaxID=773 RepID=UPI0018DB1116|nr:MULTISPECIES: hypothetical protein [Bartonella]MBH9974709.1 hypothetical protein [Bartonella choladocola]MBI0014315.1 hypothetical protein [Bartonella sp. B10834G3]